MPVVMLEMSRYAQNTNFTLVCEAGDSEVALCALCSLANFTQVVKLDIRSRYAMNTASDSHCSQNNMPMQRSNGTRPTLCLTFWHWAADMKQKLNPGATLLKGIESKQLASTELGGFDA